MTFLQGVITRRSKKASTTENHFLNGKASKKKGWLALSSTQSSQIHQAGGENPRIPTLARVVIEVASFDIHKIINPAISGKEYQKEEQLGFWSVGEYVLFRDDHTGQRCRDKLKGKVLNVHHGER